MSKYSQKYSWALSKKAKQRIDWLQDEFGLDEDIAFELVDMTMDDDEQWVLDGSQQNN